MQTQHPSCSVLHQTFQSFVRSPNSRRPAKQPHSLPVTVARGTSAAPSLRCHDKSEPRPEFLPEASSAPHRECSCRSESRTAKHNGPTNQHANSVSLCPEQRPRSSRPMQRIETSKMNCRGDPSMLLSRLQIGSVVSNNALAFRGSLNPICEAILLRVFVKNFRDWLSVHDAQFSTLLNLKCGPPWTPIPPFQARVISALSRSKDLILIHDFILRKRPPSTADFFARFSSNEA